MSISSIDPVASTKPPGDALSFSSVNGNPSSQDPQGSQEDSGLQQLLMLLLQNLLKAMGQGESDDASKAAGGSPGGAQKSGGPSGSGGASGAPGGEQGANSILEALMQLLKAIAPMLQDGGGGMQANGDAYSVSNQFSNPQGV